jgi:hypothetical protein
LSRIDREILRDSGDKTQLDRDVALARYYCNYALDKLDCSLGSLFANNRDREIRDLSNILTGSRN